MFMFPEPPPLDYYITDIAPTYLSDGVFHHGNPAPTHKYIGKQLSPIKRTLSDAPAPIQQLDPRTLERWLDQENTGYLKPSGKDNGMVFETLRWMPKPKHRQGNRDKFPPSIFPRSPQYELWYIRERRSRGFAIPEDVTVECSRKEETPKKNDEPCGLLKPPFWWQGDAGRTKSLAVGDINDYGIEKLKESDPEERKLSERLEMDDPRKYIPGAIHRSKNPEDTSMKDILDRTDAFKVVLRSDYTLPQDDGGKEPVTKTPCPVQKRACMRVHRDAKQNQDARDDDKTRFDSDSRWQPLCNEIGFSRTDLERQKELRKLTRPFLHDLHTWYSKNKPTDSSVTC
ncbi:uncharacterized protein LOC143369545 [Andrena cerasifolii]|uniref:uncharacterized protein LOC143369545 n=1 Tax=Andrena cerasifolii TaxID=2819439 RepID=UPI0040380833